MCAVLVVIKGIAVGRNKIVSVKIIDEPVRVIVDAVDWNLPGIFPDIVFQVLVQVIDSSINHRYDHLFVPGRESPRGGRLDVRIRFRVQPSDIVESMHPGKLEIVWENDIGGDKKLDGV